MDMRLSIKSEYFPKAYIQVTELKSWNAYLDGMYICTTYIDVATGSECHRISKLFWTHFAHALADFPVNINANVYIPFSHYLTTANDLYQIQIYLITTSLSQDV